MQREKLYNLHKTAYFIVAVSVFKMSKILSDQSSWRLYSAPLFFFSFYYVFVVTRVVRAKQYTRPWMFLFSARIKIRISYMENSGK
jgi:hypothetical protein